MHFNLLTYKVGLIISLTNEKKAGIEGKENTHHQKTCTWRSQALSSGHQTRGPSLSTAVDFCIPQLTRTPLIQTINSTLVFLTRFCPSWNICSSWNEPSSSTQAATASAQKALPFSSWWPPLLIHHICSGGEHHPLSSLNPLPSHFQSQDSYSYHNTPDSPEAPSHSRWVNK